MKRAARLDFCGRDDYLEGVKYYRIGVQLAIVPIIALSLAGCPWPWARTSAKGAVPAAYYLATGRDEPRELTYTLTLGDSPTDVYFAFVNYGDTVAAAPSVNGATVVSPAVSIGSRAAAAATTARVSPPPAAIGEFNRTPMELTPGKPRSVIGGGAPVGPLDVDQPETGDSATFWQYVGGFPGAGDSWSSGAVEIDATLHGIAADGGVTVRIWVHDEWWSPLAGTTRINQEKVDLLLDSFLSTGTGNDIYEWVTALYGPPYGEHGFSNLIAAPESGQEVDILLLDVLQDDRTDSGIAGFFWAKDLYAAGDGSDEIPTSNERVMFYIDAPLYGQLDEGGWDATDVWPQIMVSTLAHEFQHMIHFYQRNVGLGISASTWFNEMLSLITEDLVADKLGIDGPRGVDSDLFPEGGPGTAPITAGRLPAFVDRPQTGLFDWPASTADEEKILAAYAAAYAYGAYLGRAYGGAEFVARLMDAQAADEGAVNAALALGEYGVELRETLAGWAASMLLSDVVIPRLPGDVLPGDVQRGGYNRGGWFSSQRGETSYRLGSINLSHYTFVDEESEQSQSGLRFAELEVTGDPASIEAGGAVYLRAGSGLSGKQQWEINVDAYTDLVVAVRASE